LGKEGAELYRAAMAEEYKDSAFRDKVLLESTSFQQGQKFDKRKIMPIMGPASAGKSHATEGAIAAITQPSANPNEGNFFVNSDGEIEREHSQTRAVVDGLAKNLGFAFVSNIDNLGVSNKLFGDKIKSHIKKAVLTTDDVSLTIPDTNTNVRKNFKKDLKKYEKLDNTEIILVEVRAEAGKEAVMKDTVNQLGNARALVQGKIYEPQHYDRGVEKSAEAREIYFANSRDQKYIAIKNDLIFVTKTENGWERRTMANPNVDAIRISEHDFKTWQDQVSEAKIDNHAEPDLGSWLKKRLEGWYIRQILIENNRW
jgi:hypothetical protein